MIKGIVVRLHGHHAYVEADGVRYRCPIRGRLKKGKQRERSPLAVGDRVKISVESGPPKAGGVVESIEPRKSELYRAHPRNPRHKQVLAANVDTIVIVVGAERLEEQLVHLDRLLISAEMQNLRPVIAVNKMDLASAEAVKKVMRPYGKLGAAIHFVSAATGEGIEALRGLFAEHVSVFAGLSGMGKSSILNALQPGLNLRVGEVDREGDGRHTTTHASLLELAGGWVVDTPGIRDFGFWDLELEELSLFYPDFAPYRANCHFSSCTHRHEPDCAVRAAMKSEDLDPGRFKRYLYILREAWNDEQELSY